MEALSGTVAERAAASIKAGCDIVLHCNGKPQEMEAVAKASGLMSKQAKARAEAALAQRQTPEPIDISALTSELDALLA